MPFSESALRTIDVLSLKLDGMAFFGELVNATELSPSTVRRALVELEDAGKVERAIIEWCEEGLATHSLLVPDSLSPWQAASACKLLRCSPSHPLIMTTDRWPFSGLVRCKS